MLGQHLRRSCFRLLVIFAFICSPLVVFAQDSAHVVEDGQMLQQTDPQFVWLWRHLNLQIATAKRVCELSESQQVELERLDAKWLQELLSANDASLGREVEGRVIVQRGADDEVVRVRARGRLAVQYIRDALAMVEAHFGRVLSGEQNTALSKETAARAAFRAETLAMAAVNNIQRRIYLDAERRENLQKEIVKWAATHDELYTLMYASYTQTIPNLPQSLFDTVLSNDEVLQLGALRRISLPAIPYESQMFQHETAIIFDERNLRAGDRTGAKL